MAASAKRRVAFTSIMPAVSLARLEAQFSTPERETAVLEGSCLRGGTYRDWFAQRRFLAQFSNKRGTLLDIGCANGLLLLSLMAWAEHEITPYGIAPTLPWCRRRKSCSPRPGGTLHGRLHELPSLGLPDALDFVYWNVWHDIDFGQ